MTLRLFIVFLFFLNICRAQNPGKYLRRDTTVEFDPESKTNASYRGRTVPYKSNIPLYVLLNYDYSKYPHYEFFRIDSSHYLAYEYFKGKDPYSPGSVKSTGVKVVRNKIIDSIVIDMIDARTGDVHDHILRYRKEFVKEGKWEEFEDDGNFYMYWTGYYERNKRVGLWKRMISGLYGDDIIEEINYDETPANAVVPTNIVNSIPIDSIRKQIIGRWIPGTCDDSRRMFYSKWETADEPFSDNKVGQLDYYQFNPSGKFLRQNVSGDCKFLPTTMVGRWKLMQATGKRYIEIKFTSGKVWRLKIIYFDKKNDFFTERE